MARQSGSAQNRRDPAINAARERGTHYQVRVPDTLDLAERAALGLRHFTQIICPDHDFEMPLTNTFNESNPPYMNVRGNTLVEITPPLEAVSPLYQRRPAVYRATKPRMRTVTRFVSPLALRW